MKNKLRDLIAFIYGADRTAEITDDIQARVDRWRRKLSPPAVMKASARDVILMDESDAVLITYGDQFREPGVPPLRTLERFAERYLSGVVSGIHVLPFFPYTSDDGFSISDYTSVDSALGTWDDLHEIARRFRLMSDLVLNHCSASHRWFVAFTEDHATYRDYFITVPDGADVRSVVRPRALPLLTRVRTSGGDKNVWTTFSADQVDLNFANPAVLGEMVDALFLHVSHGSQIVRLDAIAYLWKEIGHPCIHHPKTHAAVKVFRTVLEDAAPWVTLLTETNVPQAENFSYFGDGDDEAHLVYQFSLPPLVLDAMIRGDARHLRAWASNVPAPAPSTGYFNFVASHDGVGLLPAHGFLTPDELSGLTTEVRRRGGLVSFKSTPDGEIPYELNVSYRDAVCEPELDDESKARKFLASQAVPLSLQGVPGIYVHSLIGSGNYLTGVKETGRNRTINREKLPFQQVCEELDSPGSIRNLVYTGYVRMLRARRHPAFRPGAAQRVLPADGGVFAVLRTPPADAGLGAGPALCLINMSKVPASFSFQWDRPLREVTDRISGRRVAPERDGTRYTLGLGSWEVLWMELPA